jgi:hypothetical protein
MLLLAIREIIVNLALGGCVVVTVACPEQRIFWLSTADSCSKQWCVLCVPLGFKRTAAVSLCPYNLAVCQ